MKSFNFFLIIYLLLIPLKPLNANEVVNSNLNLPRNIQTSALSPVLQNKDYLSAEDVSDAINNKTVQIMNSAQEQMSFLNSNALNGRKKSPCSLSAPSKADAKDEKMNPTSKEQYVCFDPRPYTVTQEKNQSTEKPIDISTDDHGQYNPELKYYMQMGHSNDDWKDIWNLRQRNVSKRKMKTDDMGRTQGFHGELGVLQGANQYSAKCDLIGFGKPVAVNGYNRNSNGQPYINMIQLFNCQGEAIVGSDPTLQLASAIEYEKISAKNTTSEKIQNRWHQMNQYVIYDYVPGEQDEKHLRAKIGLQSTQEAQLGSFKCRVIAKAMAGLDDSGRALSNAQVSAGLENAFIGLQTWVSRQDLPKDRRTENVIQLYGKANFSMAGTKMQAQPFISWHKYNSELDKSSRQKPDQNFYSNETIMQLGMKLLWQ